MFSAVKTATSRKDRNEYLIIKRSGQFSSGLLLFRDRSAVVQHSVNEASFSQTHTQVYAACFASCCFVTVTAGLACLQHCWWGKQPGASERPEQETGRWPSSSRNEVEVVEAFAEEFTDLPFAAELLCLANSKIIISKNKTP